MQEKKWFVYLLECLDGTYYAGATNDIEKRMEAHKSGKGSRYVAARGFNKLLATKEYSSKSDALKAEYQIKQLSREEKLNFLIN